MFASVQIGALRERSLHARPVPQLIAAREFRSANEESLMLHYAVVFLVIALVAAVLGFGGLAGASVGIAKILFLVFIVLFVVSLLLGRRRGF